MSNSWFGQWLDTRWLGPWMPGYTPQTMFLGYGPGGLATFCTDLESDFTVTYDWGTDIDKSYSGREKREARRDAPKQAFAGATLLLGTDPARIRGQLAARMAVGSPFLLGLEYEELTLTANAVGAQVFVNPAMIPLCDWLVPGQYVITRNGDDVPISSTAVLQDVNTATGALTLDLAPGASGAKSCEIMPGLAIFFEPQQNFDRYPVAVERWNLAARSAVMDFAPPRAFLDLGTINAAWAGGFLVARPTGVSGNIITVELDPFVSNPAGGALSESVPTNTAFQMKGDTDTLGTLATLINNQSSLVKMTGTYNPAVIIGSGDGFTADLSGGSSSGLAGSGAALTTYAGRYVWDWPIVVDESAKDSIQSMISIIDFGGVPVAMGTADVPDFGRQVSIRSGRRLLWQWVKKFLWSVKGSQKAFWLPTYRNDLVWVSGAGATITVSGDVRSWYPRQSTRLFVLETGNVPVYTQITAAVYNADGTTTITLSDAVDNIQSISWLELCRFESPSFSVTWNKHVFSMAVSARVVQQ